MSGLISVNGSISAAETAKLPVLDRGFLFGDSVFETLVAFHGQLLNLPEHLARLRRSAAEVHIPVPWSDEELAFELTALLEQAQTPKASVRLVLTRGSGVGLKPKTGLQPTRVVLVLPAASEPPRSQDVGLALKRKALPYTLRGFHPKTSNYQMSIVALEQASSEGFDDVLWSNADQEITECTTSNVFFIGREGDAVEIATPPAASGILPGITRQTMIALLTRAKIAVTERVIYVDEIARFDEAFVCSTVRGLVPVAAVDQHRLHSARPQSVFRQFQHLYLTWVETELGYRVEWDSGARV